MPNKKDLNRTEDYISKLKHNLTTNTDTFNFDKILLPSQLHNNTTLVDLQKLDAAPIEWNFYAPLGKDKMIELLQSILVQGLLTPVILWERDKGRYMILSGHNRVNAFKMLKEGLKDDKFSKIQAIIKGKDEITENDARQIIIDTNWVQRVLSVLEKSKSILDKYKLLVENEKTFYGLNARDIIAKDFDITGRQIDNYRSLNYLINEFRLLIQSGKVSIDAGSRVSKLDPKVQLWIYENFYESMTNSKLKKLNPVMGKVEIKHILSADKKKPEENLATIQLKVKKEEKKKIEKMLLEWLKENKIDGVL